MDYEAYHVAALALLALIPVGIYAAMSGRMPTYLGAMSLFSIFYIAGFLMLMFGVLEESNGHSESPSH